MKIHYREPNLIEQMLAAIADGKKHIDYFELSADEFNQNFSMFDKSKQHGGDVKYSFKRIPIRVKS